MEYVKICGLKDPLHVKLCTEYGANAVGFIYNVPSSLRNLQKKELLELLKGVPKGILRVITTKSDKLADCIKLMNEIDADCYQFHCGFDLREFNRLPSILRKRIIIGLKVTQKNKRTVIRKIIHNFDQFFAFLLDNSEGHGAELNEDLLLDILRKTDNSKIIIAGGISIDNVERLVKNLRPFGVDISSSLESEKGVKDSMKIVKFLHKIKEIKEI